MTEKPPWRRIAVVWNRRSGNAARRQAIGEAIRSLENGGVDVDQFEPSSADQAKAFASEARDDCVVVAAGGDGTIHAVAQGLLDAAQQRRVPSAMLGVIPLGTANDFVRSLDIAPDPLEAVEALARGQIRTIDAVRFEVDGRGEWMINVAAGGNSTEIVENIDPELKQRLGPWCYVRGAIDLLGGLSRYRVHLAVNDGPPERLDIVNMIVANGRSIATMEVAPDADLADGQLEVVVIRDAPISAQARVAADFFTGDYRQSDPVIHHRAECVDLWCDERIGFTIDGEVHWGRHFRFAIRPSVLRVVVGNAPA